MPQRTDIFELERLGLRSGEGRRLDLHVDIAGLSFGGSLYDVDPHPIPVHLDVSRTTGSGYALRLRFEAQLGGPCMRCLEPAAQRIEVDAREVSQPGGGDELISPYVDEAGELDLAAWARDALSLAVPDQITCRPECAGLCPECGANLNDAGPDHRHERAPDSRWAKLSEIRFE
jgi:uncharacterized protein